MKKNLTLILLILTLSCTTVTDSVVSAINDEQFQQLNYIYTLIQDYNLNRNRESLNLANDELNKIDLEQIYNMDYKSKVLGLTALTSIYNKNRLTAKSLLKEINRDEELYWVVSALLNKKAEKRLEILTEAKNSLYTTDIVDDYLAEAYMENGLYGEAAATFDTILLTEEYYKKEYEAKRDLAYTFMKTPPTNYESAVIASKNIILIQDLIDLIDIETVYFDNLTKKNIYKVLQDKNYFFNKIINEDDKIQRKDLAYFLFALVADRDKNLNLWAQYKEFFNPDITDSEKSELNNMSPISDTPVYEYFYLPTLFLIEEEILELPDGENFYPYNYVSGMQLQSIIFNLKKRVD